MGSYIGMLSILDQYWKSKRCSTGKWPLVEQAEMRSSSEPGQAQNTHSYWEQNTDISVVTLVEDEPKVSKNKLV